MMAAQPEIENYANHVATRFDLRKDIPLWGDVPSTKEAKEAQKEENSDQQIGLASMLAKIDHYLLAQFMRKKLDMAHLENVRYQVKFIYRSQGREIGLAWFQEVLDELEDKEELRDL